MKTDRTASINELAQHNARLKNQLIEKDLQIERLKRDNAVLQAACIRA